MSIIVISILHQKTDISMDKSNQSTYDIIYNVNTKNGNIVTNISSISNTMKLNVSTMLEIKHSLENTNESINKINDMMDMMLIELGML